MFEVGIKLLFDADSKQIVWQMSYQTLFINFEGLCVTKAVHNTFHLATSLKVFVYLLKYNLYNGFYTNISLEGKNVRKFSLLELLRKTNWLVADDVLNIFGKINFGKVHREFIFLFTRFEYSNYITLISPISYVQKQVEVNG